MKLAKACVCRISSPILHAVTFKLGIKECMTLKGVHYTGWHIKTSPSFVPNKIKVYKKFVQKKINSITKDSSS